MELRDLFSEDSVDERLDAERVLAGLSFRDAAIVYLFACGHTQVEVGERVGLCQSQVCRVLEKVHKNTQKSGVDSDETNAK